MDESLLRKISAGVPGVPGTDYLIPSMADFDILNFLQNKSCCADQ